MKVLIVVAALLLAVVPSAIAADYGWNLSGSATDPWVNMGEVVAGEPFQLYLWLACSPHDGMAAAEFSLVHTYVNGGFTPLHGALNAGNSTDLLLAIGGCPVGPVLVGVWSLIDFVAEGGQACLGPSPGGLNATVDCDPIDPQPRENAVVGHGTNGVYPCQFGGIEHCVGTGRGGLTWGETKALYR
ncbi:MAG: hypothetical protein DHS20C21_03500 [Gemmatimonadota bacterium]|nr:MAG: hypothetical protein DHS20C21_03500 [Gemmatimonadota bacterium]